MNRSNTKPTVSQVVFNYIISLAACISSFQDGSKTTWNHNFWWLIKLVSTSTFGSQKKNTPRKQTFGLHCQAAWHCRSWTKPVLGSSPCPRPSKQLKSQSHSSPEFPWGDSKRNVQETIVFTLKFHEIPKFPTTITQFWDILGGLVLGFKSAGNCGFIIQICGFLWRMDRTDPLWQLQGGCWNGSSVHFTQLLVGKHIEIPLTKSKWSHDAKVLNQNLPGWQVNHT